MFLLISFVLLSLELVYFKVASYFNIVDRPNLRSSHQQITIRGGGIIFPISIACYSLLFDNSYVFFLFGLLIISFISFIDDIRSVNSKTRILFHLTAVLLVSFQLHIFNLPFLVTIVLLVLIIGVINAVNFMDGINGITGAYSTFTLITLWFINEYYISFTNGNMLLSVISSVLIFNIFNFRKKAKCFAGDVGSVSLAYILIFFLGQLIYVSGNFSYILFLIVYGLDTSTTIIFRIIRGENIFKPHRSHFYQFLVNEKKVPHVYVALGYAIVQLLFNFLVISLVKCSWLVIIILIGTSLSLSFIIRFLIEGKARLIK